jgi:hypothetical protein
VLSTARVQRGFSNFIPLLKGVAEAALYCAHRTSTVSPCAFCEQEGHLAAPSRPSEAARCASKESIPVAPAVAPDYHGSTTTST